MRLLIVEDNPKLAAFLARGLREQSFAADVVADGEATLCQTAINPYALIILDLGIPLVDGMETCRRLRARGSPVLILMVTARDATAGRIAGLDAGADDNRSKPFRRSAGYLLAPVARDPDA